VTVNNTRAAAAQRDTSRCGRAGTDGKLSHEGPPFAQHAAVFAGPSVAVPRRPGPLLCSLHANAPPPSPGHKPPGEITARQAHSRRHGSQPRPEVAIRATYRGTDTGAFIPGMPATGKTFAMDAIYLVRVDEQGQIAEHWGVVDTIATMNQLGLLPAPNQAPA
jgi:hypothetical protein